MCLWEDLKIDEKLGIEKICLDPMVLLMFLNNLSLFKDIRIIFSEVTILLIM